MHPGGEATFVWSAYLRGQERVFARDQAGVARQLSPGPGIYCQPRFVATGDGSGWAFWTRQWQGRFEVAGRRLDGGEWEPLVTLHAGAMAPAPLATGGPVVLAFEDHVKPQRIQVRIWDGRTWSPPVPVSQEELPSFRPALAAGDGRVWAFWDAYLEVERGYAVFARPVSGPELGPIERLSPPGKSCLKPVALHAGKTGLAAAWVATEDVTGGAGVLDHWDSIQAATRAGGGWKITEAANLQHGLLSKLEPEFVPVSGYAGRRRHPMLAEEAGALWLLWERRITPGGRADEPGQLCGRRFDGAAWGDPAILDEGLVEYTVAENPAAKDGGLMVVAKDTKHAWHALSLSLRSGRKIEDARWQGWKPVRLPLGEDPARPSIEIEGRRHFLYWGDLHVHSVLTPDAEGEVDELMHFARDKARLDVVCIQENDSNSWSKKAFVDQRLTESEYALGVYYARRYTEKGRFVAMPGWEWSQRTADDDKPNHRTVLFAGRDAPIIRHTENAGNFDELCDAVEAAGGTMFAQHEAFRLVKRRCDSNLEVATGWGIYIDPPDKIHRDLSAGFRVGFVATSDGHRRNPGTGGGITGIWAPELTPEAILDAIKNRRVFATTGSRVLVDARANGRFMGEDVEATDKVELTLRAEAPRAIERAVLVRDGQQIRVEAGNGRRQLQLRLTDRPGPGFHWYYWRVELEGPAPRYRGNVKPAEGHLAWSSPHRVKTRLSY